MNRIILTYCWIMLFVICVAVWLCGCTPKYIPPGEPGAPEITYCAELYQNAYVKVDCKNYHPTQTSVKINSDTMMIKIQEDCKHEEKYGNVSYSKCMDESIKYMNGNK